MDVAEAVAEDVGMAAVVTQAVRRQIALRKKRILIRMIRIKEMEMETVVPNMAEVLVVELIHSSLTARGASIVCLVCI